jgi:hypothetical protein
MIMSLLVTALVACSDSAIPIDQIDEGKKLSDLSSNEKAGVCEWAGRLGSEKLPKDGSMITCDGLGITFHWHSCGAGAPASGTCRATVKDAKACLPTFIDVIGKDPCVVLDLFTMEDVEDLLSSIPACQGLRGCAYTL